MVEINAPDGAKISLPNIYFNGFQLGLSNADINGLLLLNNEPQIGINMSYTTAKTLIEALTEMINALERVTEKNIMTTIEVGKGLDQLRPELGENNAESK